MAYYNRFGENYDQEMEAIKNRRDILIEKMRPLGPSNFVELLEDSEDGELDYDLPWVSVPDPRDTDGSLDKIEVQPTLHYWRGDEEDGIEPGLSSLELVGRLASGEERAIGTMHVFDTPFGTQRHEPYVSVNLEEDHDSFGRSLRWDSADAELFLTLAESALAQQQQ